jgi:hypothetical protein
MEPITYDLETLKVRALALATDESFILERVKTSPLSRVDLTSSPASALDTNTSEGEEV